MRFLPMLTIGLWLVMLVGFVYARSLLLSPYVLFPLFTVLSIFLPIAFWMLQFARRRAFSLCFVAIFAVNCLFLGYFVLDLGLKVNAIEPFQALVINPEQAEQVFSGEREKTRMNMSRYLYENSGVVTAYRKENGELEIYAPTDLDKSVLYENYAGHYRLLETKNLLTYYMQGVFLLLAIHVVIFVGLLVYLIFVEGPGGRQKSPF